MNDNFKKLVDKLIELFMLDQPDLDFGIYRIMNSRRRQITKFLQDDLLPQVREVLSQYESGSNANLSDELKKAVENAKGLGIDPDSSPKVKELKAKIAEAGSDVSQVENEVYSHLYNFFSRYYKDGDFLSLRRYKEGVYAIPYEGEEVKLYWANHDQYYIKTSEYLRDYTFYLPNDKKAHFKIVEADMEKDNRKESSEKERRFSLAQSDFWAIEEGEFILKFHYLPLDNGSSQKDLNLQAVEAVLAADIPVEFKKQLGIKDPTEKDKDRTILAKHLTDYTSRFSFDYFIHKDLGGFLSRELDFYIKNEVMHLDDIEEESAPKVEQYLAKIRAIRKVAAKIITFLAQLEDFQKKLWLKKKFVTETNYCITLDRILESFYAEIAANQAQHDEWVKLFAIDEIKAEKFSEVAYFKPLTVEFLKANPYLLLDTKFFDDDFKQKMLASIENLDEQTDGLLIHSENFQALNLLQDRYKKQVKCIYIDPPYNTSASEIIYKNGYKSSSWLSYIDNRLNAGKLFLEKEGMQCVTIDDFEFHKLREIISNLFGEDNIAGVVAIKNNPSGRSTVKGFSIAHEYGIFAFASEQSRIGMLPRTEEQLLQYKEFDESGQFQWRSFIRSGGGNDVRSARPKLHYPLIISGEMLSVPELRWDEKSKSWLITEQVTESEQVIYPISNGVEYTWRLGIDTLKTRLDDIRIRKSPNGKQIIEIKFYLDEEGVLPKTIWDDKYVNATAYGTTLLRNIMGVSQIFSFPKSIYAVLQSLRVCGASNQKSIVLDYFAGSATTGHAVINLNREDNGKRKYILIEMGEYFDTVTKPRIQKVVYSKDWKDGKPASREGISHCFKYIRLESYEDTLNNLVLELDKNKQMLLESNKKFKESYMLGYMLDVESKGSLLNIDSFKNPFDYKLNIATSSVGQTKPVKIDLVETFNYLIGLKVKTSEIIRGFKVITGESLAGEKILVIWRNINEKDNEALDEFCQKMKYNPLDMEFDIIYVNGDNNLENLKRDEDTWKVRMIEEEFTKLMFDVEGL